MTCGGARSVRSSSPFHRASSEVASSDGHNPSRFPDWGARRGHTVIARSPSDGHDNLRSSSHLVEVWKALDRLISIGWATPADDSRKQDPIATRSWSDPRAIMVMLERNHGPLHRGMKGILLPNSSDGVDQGLTTIVAHDRGSIMARSLCDRGLIA